MMARIVERMARTANSLLGQRSRKPEKKEVTACAGA